MGLIIQIVLYLEKVFKCPSLLILERTNLFKKLFIFNLKREGLCLHALRLRTNIYLGPPCLDGAITWKKSSQRDRIHHL